MGLINLIVFQKLTEKFTLRLVYKERIKQANCVAKVLVENLIEATIPATPKLEVYAFISGKVWQSNAFKTLRSYKKMFVLKCV